MRDHSGIIATWHHLEPESLEPVFPFPCSAAIGNCSGYLAAKWHGKNQQMHPKQHLAPTTRAGSGWQGAGRVVAAPSPSGTSWVGAPATSTEDETPEETNLPRALNSHTGCDPSFPADLRCHLELGWALQHPVLTFPLPSSTRGRNWEGTELGWPMATLLTHTQTWEHRAG